MSPSDVSFEDQLKAARRELAMRQRVYPKWVENGRMKQAAADKEIAAMEAITQTLSEIGQLRRENEQMRAIIDEVINFISNQIKARWDYYEKKLAAAKETK